MNRRAKHFLAGAFLTAMLTTAVSAQAFAARIAFSDPSGDVGEEITVSMKITATADSEIIYSSDVMLSYDSASLEFLDGTGASGGAGSIRVTGSADSTTNKELAFSLRFRALKAGNTTITVSTQEVYDADGSMVNITQEGNSSITISGSDSASSDAFLSALSVSPGSISPTFSEDVMDYTMRVGGDTDVITVSATPRDGSATIDINGNEALEIGDNDIVITVTSQDGLSSKVYTIHVTKVEGAVTESNLENGVSLRTPERDITVLTITEGVEVPEGFAECSVSIDGHDVQGWVWADEDEPSYCIFYAMNENGEIDFYRYDLKEKTLQRYFRDPSSVTSSQYTEMAEEYNDLLKDYNTRFWIIIGLIVLSVILLIIIIVLLATRGPKDDFYEPKEKDQDREDYPQRLARERNSQSRQSMSREERYLAGMEIEDDNDQDELLYYSTENHRTATSQTRPSSPQPTTVRRQTASAAGQSQAGSRPSASSPSAPRQSGRTAPQTPSSQSGSDDDNLDIIDLDL